MHFCRNYCIIIVVYTKEVGHCWSSTDSYSLDGIIIKPFCQFTLLVFFPEKDPIFLKTYSVLSKISLTIVLFAIEHTQLHCLSIPQNPVLYQKQTFWFDKRFLYQSYLFIYSVLVINHFYVPKHARLSDSFITSKDDLKLLTKDMFHSLFNSVGVFPLTWMSCGPSSKLLHCTTFLFFAVTLSFWLVTRSFITCFWTGWWRR